MSKKKKSKKPSNKAWKELMRWLGAVGTILSLLNSAHEFAEWVSNLFKG